MFRGRLSDGVAMPQAAGHIQTTMKDFMHTEKAPPQVEGRTIRERKEDLRILIIDDRREVLSPLKGLIGECLRGATHRRETNNIHVADNVFHASELNSLFNYDIVFMRNQMREGFDSPEGERKADPRALVGQIRAKNQNARIYGTEAAGLKEVGVPKLNGTIGPEEITHEKISRLVENALNGYTADI